MGMTRNPEVSRTLAQLYDADLRKTDPLARNLAQRVTIPHPLTGVEYADGVYWHPNGWRNVSR